MATKTEKIEKGEGLSYIDSKQVQYENVEKTSIYFDDDNNQVKEFKSYKDGVFNSKNLHIYFTNEVKTFTINSDSS